jgi:hypothetical protein
MHLIEASTIRWSLNEIEGRRKLPEPHGRNAKDHDLIAILLDLYKQKEKEARTQSGTIDANLARQQRVAVHHFVPALLTITECRANTTSIPERASFYIRMDIPLYGNGLLMGNGTTVKQAASKPTQVNRARDNPVFRLADRLTSSLGDAVHSGNFSGHHPAQLRLLLNAIRCYMAAGDEPRGRLRHTAQTFQDRMLAITRAGMRDEELADALIETEIFLKDAVRHRLRLSTPKPELPLFSFHLHRNPYLNGVLTFQRLYSARTLVAKFEAHSPDWPYNVPLYSMLSMTGGSQQIWEEAEYIINRFGCPKIF